MKVLIAIPCMDTVPTGFVRSILSLQLYGEVEIAFSQGSLVYDSRNSLADKAAREGFDRIFWIDSDMTLPANAFSLLMEDLDRGLGMVSGIYFKRKAPIEPVLFSTISSSTINGGYTASAQTMTEVPEGITLIEGVGFGCVMMEREHIDKVRQDYFHYYTNMVWGSKDGHHFAIDTSIFGIDATVKVIINIANLKFGL